MKITINGTEFEINSQSDIDALRERFGIPYQSLTPRERFTSLNILNPFGFNFKELTRRWNSAF